MENENVISCKICLFPYDSQENIPRIIDCGHTLCSPCLEQVLNNNNDRLICPFCKKESKKSKETTINYEIIEINQARKVNNYCKFHKNEGLNFYCANEEVLICQFCMLESHLGHNIQKPSESKMKEMMKIISDFKNVFENYKSNIFSQQTIIKKHFSTVDSKIEELTKYIRDIGIHIKYDYYSKLKRMKDKVKSFQDFDARIKSEYEKIKYGEIKTFSNEIIDEFKNLNEEKLIDEDWNVENNQYYLKLINHVNSISGLKQDFNSLISNNELSIPAYSEIENLIEYLIESRLTIIKYKLNSSIEHQKLIEKSFRNTKSTYLNAKNVMNSIDRADFVAEITLSVYQDSPLSIGWNTTISAPHMHMITLNYLSKYIDQLPQEGCLKSIDIGCGSGYMTLALCKLLGPNSYCIGLDHIQQILDFAKKNIEKRNKSFLDRIGFVLKDGKDGYADKGPYHIIHLGAAIESITDALTDQLIPGGVLWAPVGPRSREKKIILLTKDLQGNINKTELMGVNYSEMISVEEQLGNHD